MYRVSFINQGKVYEVYVKHVSQPDLYGFVALEDFVFDTSSSILIDPVQKALQAEFEGVKRSYVPMHAVIRIDDVEKVGTAKVKPGAEGGNVVTPFPLYGTPKPHPAD